MTIHLKKEKLEVLMKYQFYTINSLAKKTDLSYAIILNAINHNKPLSMKSAEKICKLFEVGFDDLFTRI